MNRHERKPTERFSYHSLSVENSLHLLQEKQQVVLDHFTGYSLVVDWERQQDQILNATIFTEEELSMVLSLITRWPSFVPYERLFAYVQGLSGEAPTASDIDDARASGTLNQLIAPLHDLVETCRTKLQGLDLDIREIDQYGYRLAKRG